MYLVKKTLHYTDKKTGEKQVFIASNQPQNLPKPLIKEALERGLAVKAEVAETPAEPELPESTDESETSDTQTSDSTQ